MNMKKIILTAISLALVLSSGWAAAQALDATKIRKIPRYTTLSQKDFDAASELFEVSPENDKYLAFTARLPKGWKRNTDTAEAEAATVISAEVLSPIARFRGPTMIDAVSRFEVSAIALEHDISARNWFLSYLLQRSYTLEGLEQVDGSRVEALYVIVEGDTSYIVRTVAQINGTRMVLASYYLPEQRWEQEKAAQEKVIQSFKFTAPEKVKVDTVNTYAFLDLLRFDYPVSWRLLAPNISSVDAMDAKLVNMAQDETVTGEIEIHLISSELDTTLAQEVGYIKDDLAEKGLEIGKLIETPEGYKLHDHIFYNRVEVYEIADKAQKLQNYEYWLTIMAEDRYYYIITMLGVGRKGDFYNWARNAEAFRTVIESIRP